MDGGARRWGRAVSSLLPPSKLRRGTYDGPARPETAPGHGSHDGGTAREPTRRDHGSVAGRDAVTQAEEAGRGGARQQDGADGMGAGYEKGDLPGSGRRLSGRRKERSKRKEAAGRRGRRCALGGATSRLPSLFSGKSGKRFAGPPSPRGGFGEIGPGRRYTRLGHANPMLSKRLVRLPASLSGLPALAHGRDLQARLAGLRLPGPPAPGVPTSGGRFLRTHAHSPASTPRQRGLSYRVPSEAPPAGAGGLSTACMGWQVTLPCAESGVAHRFEPLRAADSRWRDQCRFLDLLAEPPGRRGDGFGARISLVVGCGDVRRESIREVLKGRGRRVARSGCAECRTWCRPCGRR